MKINSAIFHNRVLSLVWVFLLIAMGCKPTPLPTTPREGVSFNITIDRPIPIDPNSGTLPVKYRVDCFCTESGIRASLSLTPTSGTPPYVIPGFEFVESQTFNGMLGDTYSITIKSSDIPPLTWMGDIKLECSSAPVCPAPTATLIAPTSTPSQGSSNSPGETISNSGGGNGSKSGGDSGENSGGNNGGNDDDDGDDNNNECKTKNCDKKIDKCPPTNTGGEPPGICKKN